MFAVFGAYKFRERRRIRARTEPVEATVVESRVNEVDDGAGSSYEPDVRYRFEYDGRQHEPTGVEAGSDMGSYDFRSEAQDVVDRYDEGDTVTARVDPHDVERSYVEEDRIQEAFYGVTAAFGLVFALAGVGLAVL